VERRLLDKPSVNKAQRPSTCHKRQHHPAVFSSPVSIHFCPVFSVSLPTAGHHTFTARQPKKTIFAIHLSAAGLYTPAATPAATPLLGGRVRVCARVRACCPDIARNHIHITAKMLSIFSFCIFQLHRAGPLSLSLDVGPPAQRLTFTSLRNANASLP
jgi:hypothetical protein